MRKPDIKIYQLACRELGVQPEEVWGASLLILCLPLYRCPTYMQVVFLDDLGVNLKGARSIGMQTILVRDPAKALNELQQLLHEDGDIKDPLSCGKLPSKL